MKFTFHWLLPDGSAHATLHSYEEMQAGETPCMFLHRLQREGEAKGWRFEFCQMGDATK